MTRLYASFAAPPANSGIIAVTLFVAVVLLAAPSAGAQSAKAPAGGDQSAAKTMATTPDLYEYKAEGRRDPFLGVSTTHESARPLGVLKRGDGPAAYAVNEISVRGVMQRRGLLIAVVQGPDKRTYVVHSGDQLADGFVKAITSQGLVIVQNSSDPVSLQKHREVLKLLPSFEDTKE